jgi:threonine/homoserine/homoserine lactone efflux protein
MNGVIGQILPFAVTIAVSPIPIIASILMLLSPRAKSTSVAFLLGWVAGIAVGVVVFTLLSSVLGRGSTSGSVVVAWIKLVLGVLLIVAAVGQWRKRPHEGTAPVMPKWMAAIDSMTPLRSGLLGAALSGLNPKNLMMAIAAGLVIGPAGLSTGDTVVAIVVFVVIAMTSVAVPVFGYLIAADRFRGTLERLREWLTQNNAIVMSVLLLLIGVVTFGKGLQGL